MMGEPGSIRNLFDYEGWEITSSEEGLGEFGGVDVEVINQGGCRFACQVNLTGSRLRDSRNRVRELGP